MTSFTTANARSGTPDRARHLRRAHVPVRRLLLMTALLSLATACTADHFARYEGVTPEAGNAKAVNVAQTVIDTTPASAHHTALPADGARMAKTIEWYRTPPRPEAKSGSEDFSVENAEPREE